jgi:hypothetical protein
MVDLGDQVRRIFDPVGPVTLEEIESVAERRRKRHRRMLGGSGGIAALTAAVVAFLLVTGTTATKVVVRPESTPSSAGVRLQGVQIVVPYGWPVLGGNNTHLCQGEWPTSPVVYVGVQPAEGSSCPALHDTPPPNALDGVWLQPQTGSVPGLVPYRLPSGQSVEEAVPPSVGPGTSLLFHGVWLLIGRSTSPADADSILVSLSYHPDRPNTAVAMGCGTNSTYTRMPRPQRLTNRLVVGSNITLEPPLAKDQASVPPAVAWNGSQGGLSHLPTNTYRLFLARYSAQFPATVQPNGSTTPDAQNVLAWVLYASPVTPTNPTCGQEEVAAFDAHTGKMLGG